MNQREKIVQKQFLNNEQAVIKRLNQVYNVALKDITGKVAELDTSIATLREAYNDIGEDGIGELASAVLKNAGAMTPEEAKETIASRIQSKVYQKQYQKALKSEVGEILDKMQKSEFLTVSDYLDKCYEDGFIGTMYNLQGQGIPLAFPLDQEAMVRAVQLDSKISQGLYTRLGEDVGTLKQKITAQVSRSVAMGLSYRETAQQLAGYTRIGYNNAVRIARTEGHRVQVQSAMDACYKAQKCGADVVKQWDSTLDARTRESHVAVDGEVRELDEKFSNGLRYPGDPSGGAAEVVNCRCALLQRARWALDDDFDKWDNENGELVEIKAGKYEDFKREYYEILKNPLTNSSKGDIMPSGEIPLQSYSDNPYVFNVRDLPPAIYQFKDYDDFCKAIDEWRETHTGSPYDYYVQNSNWRTSDLTDEQIERLRQFDATIAKLQTDYPLPAQSAENLYIGTYDDVSIYLNDIQRSRMDGGIAQAQFWYNTDRQNAVVGFNVGGTKGTLADDLALREKKISSGERLQTVLDNSPEGVAIHEWGHGFTDYIGQEMVYGNPSAEDYWKWYKSLSKDEIADGLSVYAATNRSEFEAECFAELLTGNPRPIAVKFSEYLEKCSQDSIKRLEMYGVNALKTGTAGKIDFSLNYAIKKDTSSIKSIILPTKEYAHVMSEIATNLTEVQKQQHVVSKAIGKYIYTFENNGFGDYRIIGKKLIDEEARKWWDE